MIFKRKNIWLFIFIDSFVIGLSLIGSYLLRFDFVIPKEFIPGATYFFVVLLFSKLAVNVLLNVYSGLWRYTSFNDLLNILKASTAGTVLSAALSLMVLGLFVIPRSIFFIDYILTTIGFISTRAAVRFYSNFLLRKEKKSNRVNRENKTKLLLLGAGWSAEKIVREILENPSSPYSIVGFLDDDDSKSN